MKKITFSLVLLAFVIVNALQAQTEKGSFLLGSTTNVTPGTGGIGIGFGSITQRDDVTNNEDKVNTLSFNINPTLGYFIAKDFALGLSVNYGYSRFSFDQEKTSVSAFGVSPFARYYFSSGAKFRPFADVSGSFTSTNTSIALGVGGDTNGSDNLYGFGLGVGGAFFLNDKVSLDFMLNYTLRTGTNELDILGRNVSVRSTDSRFGIGVGFSFFL